MKKRILFIDDESYFLEGLKRLLHRQCDVWDVYFAHSVDAALNEISKVEFDAIISDVTMPGKDGFELLRILKDSETTKDVPVVILTGRDDHNLKSRALEMGATDLLSKPVNHEDLLARLNSVLRLKSYQDELKDQNKILDRKVKERTAELEESRLDIILRLGKAAEYRDEETGNHILRVGCYCRALAEELDMACNFVEMIFLTSPLHDIGKIGIPDKILLKSGVLAPAERKIMERHCIIGADILRKDTESMNPYLKWHRNKSTLKSRDNFILDMASTITLYHHEKWDGSGYPKGLQGQDIPLAARIVALADIYDALRTARPYKPAYSQEHTLGILRDDAGHHFDPMIYNAFEKIVEQFNSIHNQFSDDASKPKKKAAANIGAKAIREIALEIE